MEKPEILTEAEIAAGQGIPALPKPCMGRNNILDTIDQMLQGVELAILEGPEGRGKTVTATLYAYRHHKQCINIFINPASRWAYHPMAISSDIAIQIAKMIGKTIDPEDIVSPQEYELIQFKMRSWLKNKNRHIFFIVDGLFEIPQADSHYAGQIWDMLPFGIDGCKFLITKDSNTKIEIPNHKSSKDIILVTLGSEESAQYLESIGIEKKIAEQIQRTCNGQPNWLASVQRLISSGIKVEELSDKISKHLPDLFEIEWKPVASFDKQTICALAILAHDQQRHSMANLARILSIDEQNLKKEMEFVSFLDFGQADGAVTFVSEAFRRFAADKLQIYKMKVSDIVIQDLIDRRGQKEVAAVLPAYLNNAGRFKELLEFLTPENFDQTLKHSQSLVPVKEQVKIGIDAALKSNRDSELVRFAIYNSALLQLETTEFWKSEVEARIALDDFPKAYALATAAGIKEDRLHLLAVIAKEKVKRSIQVEAELIESIKSLYAQIDCKHLGKRGLEIASDLIYSVPALAVEMVEESSASDTEKTADIAIATLALMAAKSDRIAGNEEYASEIQAKIRSPEIKRFIEEVNIRTDKTSAKELLRQIKQLPTADRKLFFARRWLVQNRRREDAHEVLEESLGIALKAAEYTPNARDMREMASPLPYMENKEKLHQLVATFAANKANIEKYGPSIDYIRFLLLLARGEFRHDFQKGRAGFEEAYLGSLAIGDFAIKAECFGWLLVALELADEEKKLEASDQLHSLAETGIRETAAELLKTSGLQDIAFSGLIASLASTRPDFAVEIALSLNTETTRDEALAQIVVSLLSGKLTDQKLIQATDIEKKKDCGF